MKWYGAGYGEIMGASGRDPEGDDLHCCCLMMLWSAVDDASVVDGELQLACLWTAGRALTATKSGCSVAGRRRFAAGTDSATRRR